MSINDFIEMTIFLCLIRFSNYNKMQGFVDECVLFFYMFKAKKVWFFFFFFLGGGSRQ